MTIYGVDLELVFKIRRSPKASDDVGGPHRPGVFHQQSVEGAASDIVKLFRRQDVLDHAHPFLDGEYASFGKIIEGMDVADAIVSVPRDGRDKPKKPQRMAKVTIEED